MYFLSIDVGYDHETANAVGVGFLEIQSPKESFILHSTTKVSSEYIPGEFYKKELPAIMDLLQKNTHPLKLIFIDGYVWLGKKKGLGAHLSESIGGSIPIIGIAKTKFHGAEESSAPVIRGKSTKPV